jgi:hypothetical protein
MGQISAHAQEILFPFQNYFPHCSFAKRPSSLIQINP